MFYDNKEDLIDAGLLNHSGEEDNVIKYDNKECVKCSRLRVEIYQSGIKVCEKCGTDQNTGEYVEDRYYDPY